eukprot:m.443290 g.443290  ORF g.443290 m.443290 type:complete len:146 (+) comp21483_c0_seq9:331-768(+)
MLACIEVTPPRRTACVLKRALIDGILSDALLQANPRPTLVRSWPFVDEQPTGMLVNGDALFVAGGQDIMIFDIGSKAVGGSPLNTTLVASCGNACAAAMPGAGQNAHSLGYSKYGNSHLLFLSAQTGNNVGIVEITSPAVISLLV